MALSIKSLTDEEFIAPGRSGCAGCAGVLAARLVLKVLGPRTIMVSATGCVLSNFTHAGAPSVPFIHSLLPGAGSVIAGIEAGLEALGKREGVNLLAMGGDGGTADIGLQALSGAMERGHRFIYVCYDNEGYMNTGGQRSATTPYGARTTTTPSGKDLGRPEPPALPKKDMLRIMAAHGIPYVANASLAFPQDLIRKVQKAADFDGPSYLQILSPCNYRWGFRDDLLLQVAKAAVETRVSPLLEIEGGRKLTLGRINRRALPVETYLQLQDRFRLLGAEDVARIQGEVDEAWAYLCGLAELSHG